MRKFEVLEKHEHYFRCNIDGKENNFCFIIIDENSKEMPLGSFSLHVEDISDRYQHSTKITVFRLTLPFSQQDSIEICTLKAGKKNRFTYAQCLKLGGQWEPIINEWVFSASVKDKVEELRNIVQSELTLVQVEFKETISEPNKSLTLFGFELVKGININRTPILCSGITLKKGDITYIPSNNSKTIIQAGSIIRLSAPKLILESNKFKEDYLCATEYRVIKTRKNS